MFLFVVALSWWAKSLDPSAIPDSLEFATAVVDLNFVLQQLTLSLATPLPSPPIAPIPEVQADLRSKRKITLTEKALGGGENVGKRFRR